jgi:hypothetical protein
MSLKAKCKRVIKLQANKNAIFLLKQKIKLLNLQIMKHQIILLFVMLFTFNVNAQNSDVANKQYFQEAKTKLENMLADKEKLSYENAIFTIENAWYENGIDQINFDTIMAKHINNIEKIIALNYDETTIKQKPTFFLSQQTLINQYKKALTNWAIYTYITKAQTFADSNDIYYHAPYKYSTADPMASNNWENTQVINLNNNKHGNCFALASLFKIFSDRLESDATLCTAPSHIYISHKDEKGTNYNVELGSKNFPGTGMISALTYTTNQAIKNEISQRTLTAKQSIALCLVYLAKGYQHKFNNTTDEFILQCAETAIQYDPKNLNALLLKAEYLENKLIAQHKTISQLQTQTDFKEYQTLIANLYTLGYREMPLEMKNTLIKNYKHEPINKELPKFQTDKGKFATLTWGIFDERHTNKATERISNTIFNTVSKKITSFAKEQNLYNNYNFDPVVFAWNVDPMTASFPSLSPYVCFDNNPILLTDPNGDYSRLGAAWRNIRDGGRGIEKSDVTKEWGYQSGAKDIIKFSDGLTKTERTERFNEYKKTHTYSEKVGWINTNAGTISEYKPDLMDKWADSKGIIGSSTYGFANSLYTVPQLFTHNFNGGWYNLNGSQQVGNELTSNFLMGATSFVPMANSEKIAANVADVSMRSLSLKLHPRLTNIGIEGMGKGQFDVAHRASAFFQKEIMSNGSYGFKNWRTFYYNHTIGNTNFSIGINPWKREIFHSGIGVFK